MIGRRAFLVGVSAVGCSRRSSPHPEAAPTVVQMPVVPPPPPDAADEDQKRGVVKVETWKLGEGRAVTIVPQWTAPDEKLPMLLALHGRGEALKGPDLGVLGWPNDYSLLDAIVRVTHPPLTAADFQTFVEPERLASHNDALAKRRFAGLVIVCPYSPDVDLRKPPKIREYGDYVMNDVVARARRELPVLASAAALGIDGVSLGGALALRIGLAHADAFGAVGTLQPAIGEDQVPELTELAKAAKTKNPALRLRLLTSSEDYFKRAIRSASSAWRSAGVAHDFEDVPGPHDYPFNRGPGAIEMLLWHDRHLARG